MPLNTYVLEQMVAVRLAEARAAARRDALVRAASGSRAAGGGWPWRAAGRPSGLADSLPGWEGIRKFRPGEDPLRLGAAAAGLTVWTGALRSWLRCLLPLAAVRPPRPHSSRRLPRVPSSD